MKHERYETPYWHYDLEDGSRPFSHRGRARYAIIAVIFALAWLALFWLTASYVPS